MDAGHGFAVVDAGVALLKEPLDAGLRRGCAGRVKSDVRTVWWFCLDSGASEGGSAR
jgi:hypothetical protein